MQINYIINWTGYNIIIIERTRYYLRSEIEPANRG